MFYYKSINLNLAKNSSFQRIIPFAVYMLFIAASEALSFLDKQLYTTLEVYLYPVKILSVAILIFFFRKNYEEIKWKDLLSLKSSILSIAAGTAVFLLWIRMDMDWGVFGKISGYNPFTSADLPTSYILAGVRLAGASLVVPVMEELFWRSWLARYLISEKFETVPIGKFTITSFVISATLFGAEHNLWAAGIMAGLFYNFLVYRTKSIAHCILSHGITNLLLGIYVLTTGRWEFW